MTDTSLFYESDVTIRSVYGAPMKIRTTGVDAETSTQKEIDRRMAAWMVAAQAGDRAVYETLLRDCIPFIARVARGEGIRPDLIDDVVQETLLTVHRARQTYDPNRSFTAWLRLRSGVRSTDCGALAGCEPMKFTHHSLTKTIRIQAAVPRSQHSTSTKPKYSIRPWANSQVGSARRLSISHSSPNRLRRPQRLLDGRSDRSG